MLLLAYGFEAVDVDFPPSLLFQWLEIEDVNVSQDRKSPGSIWMRTTH